MKILGAMVLAVSGLFVAAPVMGANQKPPLKKIDDIQAFKGAKRMEIAKLAARLSGSRPTDESLVQAAMQQLDGIVDTATLAVRAKRYIAELATWMKPVELLLLGGYAYKLASKEHSISAGSLAFAAFSTAVDMGSLQAQNNVAYCVETGIGVAKDEKQAVIAYKQLADKNPAAKDNYARCLLNGIGIEKNEKAAVLLYKEAAEAGCLLAAFHYGCCLLEGVGIDKDCAEAIKVMRICADGGVKEAMQALYKCYWNGHGVDKNKIEAMKWFAKCGYKSV